MNTRSLTIYFENISIFEGACGVIKNNSYKHMLVNEHFVKIPKIAALAGIRIG